jgi:D-glycero-beta-D-manno-heptose-7-phosphate kinase
MPGRDYQQVFEQFLNLRVMVIGDVMVDAYILGKVERISPEAPVPVVLVEQRVNRLGGAANVALNLKSLGAEAVLCSVIGQDKKGVEFLQLLSEQGIPRDAVLTSEKRITTAKFRVFGNNSQMLRVDEEVTGDLSLSDQTLLLGKIREILEKSTIHAIILQDYNKGVLTAELIREVIQIAASHHIPVAVDPKRKNFLHYKGVSLFKPNLKELRDGLGLDIRIDDRKSLEDAASFLHREMDISTVLVTLSEQGVFISRLESGGKIKRHYITAHRRNISDVSGAGDTVISVAALGLASGLGAAELASLANLAGGLVCEEVGVVPVNRDKLLGETLCML